MKLSRIVIAAAALACLAVSFVRAEAAAIPGDGVLNFSVMRKGDEIGRHVMKFEQKDDGSIAVDIRTRVKVKLLMITAYHFEHDSTELWKGGRLVSQHSKTDDDGDKHVMKVALNGGNLEVTADGAMAPADPEIIPASLWNVALVKQGVLLNTLDGSRMKVNVSKIGEETVPVRGSHMKATHYHVTGDLERHLWYTDQGLLVKVRFNGDDGSEINYILD